MKDPKNTVTDVAYQLNFSSSNPFSSVFRKYMGCTPTYFRAGYFSAFFSALSS
ncbi:AraC family transcriptional regulator, partial [Faecalicatena contorta]|uniref:AraC family transcriptional regulator n=1 Tax=Faecalicatena contorta TaxID=39482 RepID=UPI003D2ECA10